jgi:hypothetical protein
MLFAASALANIEAEAGVNFALFVAPQEEIARS